MFYGYGPSEEETAELGRLLYERTVEKIKELSLYYNIPAKLITIIAIDEYYKQMNEKKRGK
jgi:hypothetical protein